MGQSLSNGVAQFLSDVLIVAAFTLSLCIGYSLRAGGRAVSRNVERIMR